MTIDNKITPWEVKGHIDYQQQIDQFSTIPIDQTLIDRWEKVTNTRVHHFIRRGIIFSHQDINNVLDCVERHIPIYVYTGRGPSSTSMHLGHLVPFLFTKYLQDALKCIVIIQLSDDEKFIFKDGIYPEDLAKYKEYSYQNARDIIACGFDKSRTLIFSNLESNNDDLYFNNVLLMKHIHNGTIKSTYGLGEILPKSIQDLLHDKLEKMKHNNGIFDPDDDSTQLINDIKSTLKKFSHSSSSSVGQCTWPIFQCGPSYCTSFRKIFIKALMYALDQDMPDAHKSVYKKCLKELSTIKSKQSIMCIVPMAIDQAPYFRLARDSAYITKCPKPATIYSKFLPSLSGVDSKMSSTGNSNNVIFLDYTEKKIKKAIMSAFSGGKDNVSDHKKYGGNIDVDVAYKYLTYFLESDSELERIRNEYTGGIMLSSEIKEITAGCITQIILTHQNTKLEITDDILIDFFNKDKILLI